MRLVARADAAVPNLLVFGTCGIVAENKNETRMEATRTLHVYSRPPLTPSS